jgi:hypothetical protein
MAEEGVKAPQLALTTNGEEKHGNHRRKTITMNHVVETLKTLDSDSRRRDKEEKDASKEPFPQKPWKEEKVQENGEQGDPTEEDEHPPAPQTEDPPPPAPRTFTILLKISELTQHYLTNTSPTLRNSLLFLLRTTIPALAKHQNSFLPFINTLWPALLPRLQDPEAYIVSNTLDVVALVCEHAGNFMRTRIEDAWDLLRKVYKRTKQQDNHSKGGSSRTTSLSISAVQTSMTKLSVKSPTNIDLSQPELYVDAPSQMIWNSLVNLLCAIAKHVTVREERFEEILDTLDPVLGKSEVRAALEYSNADAVWLRLYKKNNQNEGEKRSASNSSDKAYALMSKLPAGKPHWHFIRL